MYGSNFTASGHSEAQCASWCKTCWGNPDCHNCTSSSYSAGICTIVVYDAGAWWKIKNSPSPTANNSLRSARSVTVAC